MTGAHTTPSEVYAAVRDELIDALAAINDSSASQIVPACPEWTVKDVVAHLCGLNAELLAGVPGRLGSDEATARQVGDRESADLKQVIDEWTHMADAIGERLSEDETMAIALLADLVIHVYDLAEVLDQPTVKAATATPTSAHRYVPGLQKRVADRTGVALTVDLSDGTSWPAPDGDAPTAVTVRTSPHEFLRGVTGRLRREEVQAFDWSTDPTDILDRAWNQYGPFRT
ncbi:MAG: maleylpyruvate isomerase family mycothiol-dependent enzyme [Acidimicrobiales bacterium]